MKYYDMLSTTIVGIVFFAVLQHVWFSDQAIGAEVYIAMGYIVGYFLNAVSSLIERILFWIIGGKPSDRLLTPVEGQEWTGIKRVKFYETNRVIKEIKEEMNNTEASNDRMFSYAMLKVNSSDACRVPDLNANYAFSRVMLTAVLIVFVVLAFEFYSKYLFWVVGIIFVYLAWNRFRVKGYHYAREVLNEYLKMKTAENKK